MGYGWKETTIKRKKRIVARMRRAIEENLTTNHDVAAALETDCRTVDKWLVGSALPRGNEEYLRVYLDDLKAKTNGKPDAPARPRAQAQETVMEVKSVLGIVLQLLVSLQPEELKKVASACVLRL